MEGNIVQGVQFYRDKDLPYFELKLCDTSALSYRKHAHEEYSLGIVDKGKSSFWYDGKAVEVCPRTVVIIPPNLVHSCNPQRDDQWKYKMLFVNSKWIQGFMNSEEECLFDQPIVSDISDYQTFSMVNKKIDSLTSHVSLLEKEASIIAVFEKTIGFSKVKNLKIRKELPKLRVIKEYLFSNFLEKITLDQLEQVSGLNKFYIIRLFKEEFKIPPHTYQTLLKINYAKKQLCKYKEIAEVAYETGFYDQSHFHKVFKSHTGVTPDKYQKLI